MKDIYFSQRFAIGLLFMHHCEKEGLANCVENFLCYAEEKGWLNTEKINLDISREKASRIIYEKEERG